MPLNTPTPKSPGPATDGKPMNVWMIVSAVLAIALIIAVVSATKGSSDPNFKPVSSEEAGNTLLDFVNEIYAGQIGQSTLKSVTEKNGMYEIIVTVNNAGQDIDQTVFISQDAKLFIPQALDMADVRNQYQQFLDSGQVVPTGIVPPQSSPPPVIEEPEISDDTSVEE